MLVKSKLLSFSKGGVSFLALLLFFVTNSFASANFILVNENVVLLKAVPKIEEVGEELKSKTSINLYIVAKQSINGEKIATFTQEFSKNLQKPFILLSFAQKEQKVDILTSSKELDKIVNKDEVLDDYVIPLFVSYDKNSEISKLSAGLLNGYMEIADRVAESKGIVLESSIGSSNKIVNDLKKYLLYPILIIGLLIYIYSVYWRRKN
jgi:hypothetical protein